MNAARVTHRDAEPEGAEVDDTVPETPRPRRAADPPPSAGPEPTADVPRRARRAFDAEPESDPAPQSSPADPPSPADPDDVSAPVSPSAPARTEWLAGPAEPTSPTHPTPLADPPTPTPPSGPDDQWRAPGSAASPDAQPAAAGVLGVGGGPSDRPDAPGTSDQSDATEADTRAAAGPATTDGDGSDPQARPGAAPSGRGNGPSRALVSDEDTPGRRNLVIGLVAGAVVIALIFAGVLIRGRITGQGLGAAPTPTSATTPALTVGSLLTVDDVRPLDDKAAWTEILTQERADADTPRPSCVVADADGVPLPQSTKVRKIQAGGDINAYVLQEAFQFASTTDAEAAAAVFTQQLGGCEQPICLLLNGWNVPGVGDAASGVTTIVQDKTPVNHTLLLSRTGTVVHVVDAAKPQTSPSATAVATLLGTAVSRTCQAAGGTCTDAPAATLTPPPRTAENPEFLANADLPRITAGTGRWGGTDVATSFDFFGSQCESRDLATVSGPESRKHRAYLLQEDAAAPEGTFGVDEYILTFKDKAGADTLVKDIGTAIDGCQGTMLTAKVTKGDTFKFGANGKEVNGRTWIVTQQVNQNTTQKYRLGLVQVDRTAIYTMIPTGQTFDFNNEQWRAIAERAGQRFATSL